jgi:hypothetical protein
LSPHGQHLHHLPPQHQLSGPSRSWYEPAAHSSFQPPPTEAEIDAYFKPSSYFSQMQGIGAYSVVSQGKT